MVNRAPRAGDATCAAVALAHPGADTVDHVRDSGVMRAWSCGWKAERVKPGRAAKRVEEKGGVGWVRRGEKGTRTSERVCVCCVWAR